jgi:MinD superfamily P-loop ATPase
MKIAVASGKGGTGKTMVSTSLAYSLANEFPILFLDCDVEAPNAYLFLKPEINETLPAVILLPEISMDVCTLCGICVDVCEYNALVLVGTRILVFPQLCHGCGSCKLQCPVDAITEKPRPIGTISKGATKNDILFGMGKLTISEPMPTPIINQLKKQFQDNETITILDAPPGASCSVVATIHDADFVLLVTEPTPFGLHDLKQMVGVLSETGTPSGVIINRDGIGDANVEEYLVEQSIPVLMKIPYRVEIAEGLAVGKLLTDIMPSYERKFWQLFQQIMQISHQKETQC